MKKVGLMVVVAVLAQAAMAFPSWMGTYGIYKKHDDRANPGLFSIMMNQDYAGLHAEVGIQVNGGNWVMYPMNHVANIEGNSLYTFMPSFQFPAGAKVNYFFHGYDNWGGHIWDSRNGLNYEFTVSPNPEVVVKRVADGKWAGDVTGNGIVAFKPWNLWIDFKIKNFGDPDMIGMVWTHDNWATHGSTSATFETTLDGGYQQWGVDLLPVGTEYNHRSLGFIRWLPAGATNYTEVANKRVEIKYALFYVVNGTWYWDNNGGMDYAIVIGDSTGSPEDTDGDGLLDAWEMDHFGNLNQSATDNPDGDGAAGVPFANIIEQQTGNNPNVPNDPTGVRLMWANAYPAKGESLRLSYAMGNEANPLFGKPVYAHVGHNGWKSTYQTAQLTWNGANSRLEIDVTVPADATEINVVFTDKNGSWDNNGGKDWKIPVRP